ncbi:MAG: basic amino acid ABC transporter substrate-binding protein [Candidatus Eisenbacteria bacterium]|uniref:Basic amino acid ABC transporter substrate-binding protein n=1 Tax=Eiseniibacteriota bacterium TaxID=2212470 RepID=A0A956M2Y9_UNCEI|nr:basic amino acid ABC transporter substrate-binding protein [Candidatus Eisenbacteria bacterium]
MFRHRRFPCAIVALLIGILGCSAGDGGTTLQRIEKTKVLKVGTDASYPPFESVDPTSGKIVGFDVDLVRALAERLGAEVEFTVVPFDGIIAGLRSSKYDAVISAMTITPDRAKQVAFSTPYSAAGQSVAVRTDESAIYGVADLAGKRLGVQLATTGEMEAKKIPGASITSFDAIGGAFRDLENGNVGAVIADTPTARIFQREHGTIRLVGEPLTHEEYGIATRLDDPELKQAFDSGITELRRSGQLESLERKWGFVE